MISPMFFLLLSGVLAMAAAFPYSYYQDYYQQPSYQNYYQHQQFYPNFYQNQGFYDYPKSPLPVDNFTPYPVADRLGWGTIADLLAPVVIGSL